MLRPAYPLVLLAALAAGRAHAQEGDRYGPRPAPYAGPVAAGGPTLRAAYAPAPRAAPPMLRSLSWPGKAELRPALAPAVQVATPPPPATYASPYALRSSPAPSGRFPGMAAYAPPTPAPRPAAAPHADLPQPSTAWPASARTARRRTAVAVGAPPRDGTAAAPYAPGMATAPQPSPAPYAPTAQPSGPWGAAPGGGSNLPQGLAAPPAYVPPGPAFGPALAAQARDQAAAAASTADSLPPPTAGRYGYVGPGRTAATATPPPTRALPRPSAPGDAGRPASGAPPATPGGLGPPRPPAYARGYVLPSQAAAGAAPAPPGDVARADGARRYSVHREYGMEPDAMPVPPQFFTATADLSAPETEAAAPRNSKAAVNAARLAAAGP